MELAFELLGLFRALVVYPLADFLSDQNSPLL